MRENERYDDQKESRQPIHDRDDRSWGNVMTMVPGSSSANWKGVFNRDGGIGIGTTRCWRIARGHERTHCFGINNPTQKGSERMEGSRKRNWKSRMSKGGEGGNILGGARGGAGECGNVIDERPTSRCSEQTRVEEHAILGRHE